MPLFKKKELISTTEQQQIVSAIQDAEKRTSGEIRVFIESHCKYVDAIERATEIFFQLEMEKTEQRNGVIVYAALKDKQSAIFGDRGIFKITGGPGYWKAVLEEMNSFFKNDNIADGLSHAVKSIGETLATHFPYHPGTDKNELPDDIVFGR